MSVTYILDSTAVTFRCNYRALSIGGGDNQFNQRRAFIPFDVSAAGVTVGEVESVDLILVCTTVIGGGCTIRLSSAVDPDGIGATLDATNADWASTTTVTEGEHDVFSTGTYTWPVDKNSLDYAGFTYFRLFNTDEGEEPDFQTGTLFASSEAASNNPILRLTLFSGQVIFVNVLHG